MTAAVLAAALSISSTAAGATSTPPLAAQPIDPWLALTALSSSTSSATTAAASSAAAQSQVGRTARTNAGISPPPVPALAVIIATLALAAYILATNPGNERPNSPA